MNQPWWKRIFTQARYDRHTDGVLKELDTALNNLGRTLEALDKLPERRKNPR